MLASAAFLVAEMLRDKTKKKRKSEKNRTGKNIFVS